MTYTLDDLPPTPTPKDYLRLQFDPSHLPKQRIVGILACQRESRFIIHSSSDPPTEKHLLTLRFDIR